MKKRLFAPSSILIGAAMLLANSLIVKKAEATPPDVTLSGTVVDTFCYLQNGNHEIGRAHV